MVVLRRKSDNVALNVSYSEYGLKWTANKLGRALMFHRAFISNGRIIGSQRGLDPSALVYTEHFVPRNHQTEEAQAAEFRWLDKALKMSY